DHEVAEKTAADLGVTALPLDVADPVSFDAFLDGVIARHGRLDVLVNNAGFMVVGRADDVPLKRQLAQLDVNFGGVVTGSLAAARRMQPGSQIVNIASLAGRIPLPGIAVYAGTKAAVIAFSEAFDAELRDRDIRVSAVLPAFTNTALIDGTTTTGLLKPIQPDDVAEAVLATITHRSLRRTAPLRFTTSGAQWMAMPKGLKPRLRKAFRLDSVFTNPDKAKRAAYDARTGG
ncbi:MAG: SDR family NAD(P)-dependent oxidoreductase, partial [Alphaproteobacteria bacterium]